MSDSVKFWITYVVLVTAILAIGWNQPLRYRFMSREEIAMMDSVTPAPKQGAWMWETKRSSKLDRGAYGGRPVMPEHGWYPRSY